MKNTIRVIALALAASMLAIPVAADNFTPSVTQKDAPTVVVPQADPGSKGETKPAIPVYDENGEVTKAFPVEDLKITSMSDVKEKPAKEDTSSGQETTAPTEEQEPDFTQMKPEVKQVMEKAYTQIAKAKSLDQIAPDLPKVMKELKMEAKVEDMIVRDLIHIEAPKEIMELLEKEEDYTVELSFDMQINKGQTLIVMVQNTKGEWIIVSGDAIQFNSDGTITVSFPILGPVAFVVNQLAD